MSPRSPPSPKSLIEAPVPLSSVTHIPKRGNLPSFISTPASPTTITRQPSPDNNVPIQLQMFSSSVDKWLTAKFPPGLVYFISQNVGLVLVGISQLFFVLMGLTVKYFLSATQISATTLIFVRMSITAICCVLSLWLIKRDPNPLLGPPGIRCTLLLRGFFGFMGLLSSYQSLKGLTLSDSVTIQFLAPSVTALLGFLFLHETLSQREILAGFFCLIGVVLVSRPPFIFGREGKGEDIPLPDEVAGGTRLNLPPAPGEMNQQGNDTAERAIAVTWAFVAVFFSSMAYTTIRWIGNKAHALHSINYFSYSCTITCGLWLLFKPGHIVWVSSLRELLFIITIGVRPFPSLPSFSQLYSHTLLMLDFPQIDIRICSTNIPDPRSPTRKSWSSRSRHISPSRLLSFARVCALGNDTFVPLNFGDGAYLSVRHLGYCKFSLTPFMLIQPSEEMG
ncbi:integral membrane protein [Cryptococcus gattii E566]|uniref:Integral to membrane protein, putative n=2 Tax=Cryptococcus gattii TaxID=37769 RepID=E6R681_CRYGW|nr:Integral to membrane protein, putative [Cryptococcus gattii WM276]ADV22720.1 Integral to membrane protein, putative [Cryptococcus gattii WM276]KIR78304.1 integral membrane protein [Cryptococcus gattii EJB2]KIY33004.1 integral membrane protein [Cryptococcus gattii E566]